SLRTPAVLHHSQGCLVDAPGKLVALVGVKDLVVVDTADALLVASREHAQDVGQIVKMLEHQKRRELL
ncbi:MAG: mannose-1-phosphate guanylyltransferase, partial [Bryobacterales bacterium]|nr:mannose-1-phosphate guanylyltransferase [Bryobacterales bacterium]